MTDLDRDDGGRCRVVSGYTERPAHDFGVPLAEYADPVMAQLAEGRPAVTYRFSAKGSQASRAELGEMFENLSASVDAR